ncbi:HesA/MoeB/ThiF family protein [Thermodesulfovibrio yellowstonii]|uniref:HesA/MoeB/ThiF family protein n=1 Tax=Thermodesulfovibrio yellowstonii TaxID=28262 RepID=UPI0004140B4B|nr:HesA/MoeB/ThiF family protein [Thermodesulfovibrio islandicus]
MDFLRYSRQMLIEGWGEEGQRKLKNSTIFIAGAGGLGSPVSIYLAVAGVGKIIICDFDSVEITNLNRQILHSHTRIGINKALSAKITLTAINPEVEVIPISEKITETNALELIEDSQIILDCMDNLETRYILNEVAIKKGIPLVFGAIYGIQGMLSFIHSPETPCLKCLFPEAPPKETFPVVGATPGVIGALQALETLKYLVGIGKLLKNKLLVWDGMSADFKTFKAQKDPSCPICGRK